MIDSQSSTQTVRALDISFTVNSGDAISSMAFVNIAGEELTITATNNGAETIYSKTISLGVGKYNKYFRMVY